MFEVFSQFQFKYTNLKVRFHFLEAFSALDTVIHTIHTRIYFPDASYYFMQQEKLSEDLMALNVSFLAQHNFIILFSVWWPFQ